MKKLLFALALLIITSQGAFAVCAPDTDKFDTKGWCIDTNGQLTPKATENNGTVDGYQGGSQTPVFVITSPTSSTTALLAKQSGSLIVDMGGVTSDTLTGMGNKYSLPRATVGLTFTLATGSKETVTLDTIDIADTFLYSPGGTGLQMGDSIKNPGQAGDSVTVVCSQAGKWTIMNMRGSSSIAGATIDTLWSNNGIN